MTRVKRISPLKSIKTLAGIFYTIASLVGVVPSRRECVKALVAQNAITPAHKMFFIFNPLRLFSHEESIDPVGTLQFSDISDDHGHITCRQTFNCWHITKAPMVGLNTQCNGPLKALITVMAWFVNLMY